MAADIYTKAFQDSVKWNNLCEQIKICEKSDLEKPHMDALHNLLLTESTSLRRGSGTKVVSILYRTKLRKKISVAKE